MFEKGNYIRQFKKELNKMVLVFQPQIHLDLLIFLSLSILASKWVDTKCVDRLHKSCK